MALGSGVYSADDCKSEDSDRRIEEQKRRGAMLIRMLGDRVRMSSSENHEASGPILELPHIGAYSMFDEDDMDVPDVDDVESDLSQQLI